MKAHQRIIREQLSHVEPAPPFVPHLDNAHVRPVSYQQAKAVIEKYEWLGRMSATRHHYGLFFDPVFDTHMAGVVCVGGANCTGSSHLHEFFRVAKHEVGVLARGANVWWAPKHAGSYLIGAMIRRVRRDTPYRLLVAYSDPDAGEIGTLYQATNWTYIGRTKSRHFRLQSPDGYSFSDAKIIVLAQRWTRDTGQKWRWKDVLNWHLDRGWVKVPQARKHRYVYVLNKRDRQLHQHIESMREPYPKRVQALP